MKVTKKDEKNLNKLLTKHREKAQGIAIILLTELERANGLVDRVRTLQAGLLSFHATLVAADKRK